MDRAEELTADHLPLEEVALSDIDGFNAPENWQRSEDDESQEFPPVLVAEDRGFTLVGNHRTVWHLRKSGRSLAKCLVVRSNVHVLPAHRLIRNCTEEAMLFDALLRREIVANRSKLADMLGYSRARITQLVNLLKLPAEIRQQVLLTDEISEFQLRQLLKVLKEPVKLHEGFKALLEKKLSGRQMAVYASSEMDLPEISEDGPAEQAIQDEQEEPVASESSMEELEDVFFDEEFDNEKVIKPDKVKEDYSKPENTPFSDILIEIGNLRGSGWRARAALMNISPVQMELLEGVALIRTGLYKKAMSRLEDVVDDYPDSHAGWFYLGRCANLTGKLHEAEEYLRNAVSRAPENPDYIVELAIVLEKLKRHSEAEAFYRKSAVIRKQLLIDQ
ncbi:hypothetical protein CSA37_12690 [Candidatus Fermentibacteria bacterium]|nr:MAG: hypothetical protein CSA37_12690 [Candidatus Fermentibacteria bacterium]